jgi:energy-coupling factor transport system ATP-binding protein
MQIQFKNVDFAYSNQWIFKKLNYTIEGDKVIGIFGSNGSGKTTLGKLIMGILPCDGGSITIDGKTINTTPLWEIGERIGYLFQNPSKQLFASTVLDEMMFPFVLKGKSVDGLKKRCLELLGDLNLIEKAEYNQFTLSVGQKQRLAIAALLINNPEYLILDEPTTGLDDKNKKNLLKILSDQKKDGKGMMIISHDKNFLSELCDEIYIVDEYTIKEGLLWN